MRQVLLKTRNLKTNWLSYDRLFSKKTKWQSKSKMADNSTIRNKSIKNLYRQDMLKTRSPKTNWVSFYRTCCKIRYGGRNPRWRMTKNVLTNQFKNKIEII